MGPWDRVEPRCDATLGNGAEFSILEAENLTGVALAMCNVRLAEARWYIAPAGIHGAAGCLPELPRGAPICERVASRGTSVAWRPSVVHRIGRAASSGKPSALPVLYHCFIQCFIQCFIPPLYVFTHGAYM